MRGRAFWFCKIPKNALKATLQKCGRSFSGTQLTNSIIMKAQTSRNFGTITTLIFVAFVHLIPFIPSAWSQVATLDIPDVNVSVMDSTSRLFGITFDARTSLTGISQYGQVGYYNANGTIIPEIDAIFSDFPITSVRYPANAVMVGFDWKKSVGPTAQRPAQDLMGTLGPAQPVNFGFDEFMAMLEARGVAGSEVQIMIPIYDVTQSNLTSTQSMGALPNIAAHNADWVEYCNAPNDGSNIGGGTDWAAQRAANGHPAPYNIKIWNIGNEPWTPGEYGSSAANCNTYLSDVTPIIDAMLAIDPTLRISMPTVGTATNNQSWAYALLNSTLVQNGKVYAISQHYFPSENQVSGNPPAQGVNAVNTNLITLITAASAKGVKVFLGDYAHSIPSNPSAAQQDIAMQWQGANFEADFLLMLSQKNNLERCNFWAYGMPYAVWHPIRINAIGDYTLMPAADIYKILQPAFLEQSIAVTTSSPMATDGNPYAVRSSAFASYDGSNLNVIAVNRDKTATIPFSATGTGGFGLTNARILTGTALTADLIDTNPIAADGQGNYQLPPMSVLILEHTSLSVGATEILHPSRATRLYPNPTEGKLNFSSALSDIKVLDVCGRTVLTNTGQVSQIDCSHLTHGVYFLQSDGGIQKFVVGK
jgi:alpha-L-arabinofuranosidase